MSRRGLLSFFPLLENMRDYSGNNNHLSKSGNFHPFRYGTPHNPKDIGVFDWNDTFSMGGWFTPIYDGSNSETVLFNNLETIDGITRGYDVCYQRLFAFYRDAYVKFRFFVHNGTNFNDGYLFNSAYTVIIVPGRPNHIMVTYDGSGQSSGIQMFFNGVQFPTSDFNFYDEPFTNTAISHSFKLATANRNGLQSFPDGYSAFGLNRHTGRINFFRIHDKVLTKSEILDIYQKEKRELENSFPKSKYIGKTKTANLDLFMSGFDYYNESVNLILTGSDNTNWVNNFPIFLNGHEASNDFTNLFIEGKGRIENGTNLFLACLAQYNESIPLTITGLSGNPTASINMVMPSSANSGASNSTELFLQVGAESSVLSSSLPLFIPNNSTGSHSEEINLFIEGSNLSKQSSLPLFLHQSSYLAEEGCTIFLKTEGLYDGFQPYNENIPFYIEMNPVNSITCYLAVTGNPINSNINVSLFSKELFTEDVNLVLPQVIGTTTDSTNLFIRGI